jgi:hypothetical protein
MTEKVLQKLDPTTFHGSSSAGSESLRQDNAESSTLDVTARLKEMW